MIDLDSLDTRILQKEAARVIATMEATSDNIYKFNWSGTTNVFVELSVKKSGKGVGQSGRCSWVNGCRCINFVNKILLQKLI